MPAIISKEIWERAQFLLKDKVKRNVRAGASKPYHRYTGLIKCGDCGSSFVCVTRRWRDKPVRYEYICNGNHRYGKTNCTPHRVDETELDRLIYSELMQIKENAAKNYRTIEADVKKWLSKKNTSEKKIRDLTTRLEQRRNDQQQILLERIRDREHTDIYTEMLKKCEVDIATISEQIISIRNYDSTFKNRKAEMKSAIDLIDEIVAEGAISDSHLRMLVESIVIYEHNKRLNISILLKAQFCQHIDFYDENGEITDKAFECQVIDW